MRFFASVFGIEDRTLPEKLEHSALLSGACRSLIALPARIVTSLLGVIIESRLRVGKSDVLLWGDLLWGVHFFLVRKRDAGRG
jgi:hypothetical protein